MAAYMASAGESSSTHNDQTQAADGKQKLNGHHHRLGKLLEPCGA